MVRAEGLEPPRVSPQEPKSCVSANFTTPAREQKSRAVAMGAVYSRGVWAMEAKKTAEIQPFDARTCATVESAIPAATTATPIHTTGG
jgi:hypothetical protein